MPLINNESLFRERSDRCQILRFDCDSSEASRHLRVMRLTSPGKFPSVQGTLRVGESIHRAWVARVAGGGQVDAPELTGQNCFGQPLSGRHEHSHVLPVDLDDDGELDHVVFYVPMGMSPRVLEGLLSLREIFGAGGRVWFGLRCQTPREASQLMQRFCRMSGGKFEEGASLGSREWISWTPFVAPRYIKPRGKNSLEGQVRAELSSRGYRFGVDDVEVVDLGLGRDHFGGFELSRREGRSSPPVRKGHSIRLRFREPVSGPLSLGYGSHFGLGLFRAVG
ncbi:type I-G CRISPR-associated protein Csb2 [Pirellulaceae bacterium SH449]